MTLEVTFDLKFELHGLKTYVAYLILEGLCEIKQMGVYHPLTRFAL